MTKATLKLLESNYKTHASMMSSSSSSDGVAAMEQDVAKLVEQVVSSEAWNGKRASKLSLDDFLQLLSEFNERGIHFA